ncbi:MAG: hypothetical protein NT002_14240 [candidate division Zixibacteria bacterium]|nr:hypothetical protein [candidate division Zixibacteria bacterium]
MIILNIFKSRNLLVPVLLSVLSLALVSPCLAGRIDISSLPYTIRQSMHSADLWDTVTIAGTKLSSATGGIILSPQSGTVMHHWYVDLGSDTLEFGTGDGAGNEGILVNSLSGYPFHDIILEGGWIIHKPSNNSDTLINYNTCLVFGSGEGILVKNVNMRANGYNGKCISVSGGYNTEISGGTFYSEVDYYRSRCQFDAVLFNMAASFDSAYAVSKGYTFNISIHDVRMISTPHAGMRLSGGSADQYGVFKIYNCSVMVDAHNFQYTSYAGTCASSSNPYAIALSRPGPGTDVHHNVITSGTEYGGGRGILVEHTRGTDDNYVKIHDNNIDIHEGPNAEYDENHMETHALRIRNGCHHVHVYNNTITATGDADPASSSYGKSVTPFRYSSGEADGVVNTYSIVEYNTFRARSLGAGATAYGITFDAVMIADSTLLFRYNRIESDNILVKYGEINEGARGITLYADTFNLYSPNYNPQTFLVGHACNNWNCSGNTVCDGVYEGAASDKDINFSCTSNGTLELGLERMLKIYVRGNNSLPVSGASVWVINNYGDTVVSGTTSGAGLISKAVLYWWESRTSNDSTGYNNFVIKARKGSDSTSINHTISATSLFPAITLSNTQGAEVIDSIAPSPIDNLGALPGYNAGEALLTWTATGNDGNSGTAAAYDIRYAAATITEANWSNAVKLQNPPAPRPAGSNQSLLMTGLVPDQLYYFAMKAADEVPNVSSLSNVASAKAQVDMSLGIDSQVVAVSPADGAVLNVSYPLLVVRNIDTATGNVYHFEVATDTEFVTPAASSPPVSQASGNTTSWKVDIKLSTGITYYWRARANDYNYCEPLSIEIAPLAHVYPNPFKPYRGESATFTGLPPNSNLIIMSVSGATIRRFTDIPGGEVVWDGTNAEGNPAAAGVYLWYLEGTDISGRLLLIR